MIALSSLWLVQIVAPQTLASSIGVMAGCAVFGGLLPDLDAVDSKLQRLPVVTGDFQPFRLLSRVVRQTSPHRGWMHSLRGLAIISVLLLPFIEIVYFSGWIVLIVGYASHLLADMMNPSGIPLFYPQPRQWHILPRTWCIAIGSMEEELIFAVFSCATVALLCALMSDIG
jgi:inner membrane protein